MAVASGAPMKIGSTRRSPVGSRSRTIGVLVGQLHPHADQLHLDHAARPYPRRTRRPRRRASGVVPWSGRIEVAGHDAGRGCGTGRRSRGRSRARTRPAPRSRRSATGVGTIRRAALVEQGARRERRGLPPLELAEQVGEREPGVDDVLDEHDVAAGDVDVEVLDEPHPAAVRARTRRRRGSRPSGHVVSVPDEVGEEGHAALQHARPAPRRRRRRPRARAADVGCDRRPQLVGRR